jgi:predicted DNA-binding antitoxin AbrB/MazE fold protein
MRPLPLDSPRPILVRRDQMILKVDAIHTAGVLKPTRDLPLRENQRVRLIVQPIEEPEQNRTAAIARVKAGIATMDFFSDGPLPTREQRHHRK